MKKTFLIAGVIAGLTATNGYADIVISQTNDTPDITISVARAGKVAQRVSPKSNGDFQASAPVATQGQNTQSSSNNKAELKIEYTCPEGCIVDLHGAQDEAKNYVHAEYATCVHNNGAYCGTPSAEIVGIVGGSIVNSGKQHRDIGPTAAQIAEQEWLASGGYYDENGNPVNPGKKKR